MTKDGTVDCAVIGAGPAGLTAALYLARYGLDFMVLDAGSSRAASIPVCRNFPSEPAGISGAEMLVKMRAHIGAYGIKPTPADVTHIERTKAGFDISWADGRAPARTILFATGKTDSKPVFLDGNHDAAVSAGMLHYCPICDGNEIRDKAIAVLGSGGHGVRESLFLRSYTRDIDLVCPAGAHSLPSIDKQAIERAGIRLIDGPIQGLRFQNGVLTMSRDGEQRAYEGVYAALGCRQCSELARGLGAKLSDDCIVVDSHQRTSVGGVYAAGDVIVGLDQIATAIGTAAIAATTIRNDLLAWMP